MQIIMGDHTLDFFGCKEIVGGGPEACSLVINGQNVKGRRFDPSPLLFGSNVLIPMRKISFFRSGYVLAQIEPIGGTVKSISRIYPYMKLLCIEGGSVEFATTTWGAERARHPVQ